jgi:hypothetical protein
MFNYRASLNFVWRSLGAILIAAVFLPIPAYAVIGITLGSTSNPLPYQNFGSAKLSATVESTGSPSGPGGSILYGDDSIGINLGTNLTSLDTGTPRTNYSIINFTLINRGQDAVYGGPHCLDQKNAFLSYTLDPSFGLFLRHSVSPR